MPPLKKVRWNPPPEPLKFEVAAPFNLDSFSAEPTDGYRPQPPLRWSRVLLACLIVGAYLALLGGIVAAMVAWAGVWWR